MLAYVVCCTDQVMRSTEHPIYPNKIKVCGILPEDIERTVELRPDGIGFYDWPQEERGSTPTTREGAKYLAGYAAAHGIDPYYLTYETNSQKIFADSQEIFAEVGDSATPHLQLVGDVPYEELKSLHEQICHEQTNGRERTRIVRSLGLAAALTDMVESRPGDTYWFDNDFVDAYIFDSRAGDQHGGTGDTHLWGWSLIGMHYIQAHKGPPVWLAGGINLSNIDEALETMPLYGVDVESGVQNSDRSKNFAVMEELIERVHHFPPQRRCRR